MVSKNVTVVNKSGIHARPASELAKVAMKCKSEVTIVAGDKRVNPKSVLNLMAAMIRCGTEITVECNGETEQEDLDTLVALIESGLGE
ncbi:MAG: HPr family phosphocarrier protein [Lachnospiraceae bacterium]|nr:HPr family phosphocarrier protein [Lachnospiraceae bacterium]